MLEDESYMERRREKVEQCKLCQEGWGGGQVRYGSQIVSTKKASQR